MPLDQGELHTASELYHWIRENFMRHSGRGWGSGSPLPAMLLSSSTTGKVSGSS